MATIERRGDYQWRAKIRKHGQPSISRTFDTRRDAERWARAIEREIDTGQFIPRSEAESTTFAELADRYEGEVFPRLRGADSDGYRLRTLRQAFGDYSLTAITPAMVIQYRDDRLAKVSSGSVKRELGLLRRVLRYAQQDCQIHLPNGNPVDAVRKPSEGKARERRVSDAEIEAIIAATGSRELPAAIRLGVETAMRRSEIAGLDWRHIDLRRRVVHLPETKNGTSRDVPLSSRAIEVLQGLPRHLSGRVFRSAPAAFSHALAKAVPRARARYEAECHESGEKPDPLFLVDLHFHDLRHEATSRLFEKGLQIMEVAAITGHKDLRMLQRYTHLKAEDLAAKLG